MNPSPTSADPTIRLASDADAEDIARLSGQLGYPTTSDETIERLGAVHRHSEHAVFVAEAAGRVAGWIHVFARPSLTTEFSAEIAGLVVDESCRSRGIGEALMQHVEQWARNNGCESVRLRSNITRARAHAFYERLGYELAKTSKTFCKLLE